VSLSAVLLRNRRLTAGLLAGVAVATLAACGSTDDSSGSSTTPANGSTGGPGGGGTPPSGGPGGGNGGARTISKPDGVSDEVWTKAQAACSTLAPSAAPTASATS
jgi:hypothetical protein